MQQYLSFAHGVIPRSAPERTMVTWWIGINDTGDTIDNATISDFAAFWEQEMALYFAAVVRRTRRAYARNAGLTRAAAAHP